MSAEITIATEVASNVEVVRAYIGPGSGLAAFGSLLAVIGAVALVIVGFVWYPVKRLVRARKSARARRAAETPVIVGFVWYPVKRLVRARKSARAKRAAETPNP